MTCCEADILEIKTMKRNENSGVDWRFAKDKWQAIAAKDSASDGRLF